MKKKILLQIRIAIDVVPFLLFVIFIKIRDFITESQIFRMFCYRKLFSVLDMPHCRRQIWIIQCVFGFGSDICYVC
jgi:hypothetical protein